MILNQGRILRKKFFFHLPYNFAPVAGKEKLESDLFWESKPFVSSHSPPPLCGSIQAETNYIAQKGDHVSCPVVPSSRPSLSSLLIILFVPGRSLPVFVRLMVKNSWSWQKLSLSILPRTSIFLQLCCASVIYNTHPLSPGNTAVLLDYVFCFALWSKSGSLRSSRLPQPHCTTAFCILPVYAHN